MFINKNETPIAYFKSDRFPAGIARHFNASQKTAFLLADQFYIGAKAFDQILSFLAHPVRHENIHLVAKRFSYRRKRNPGIPACGFINLHSCLKGTALISLCSKCERPSCP